MSVLLFQFYLFSLAEQVGREQPFFKYLLTRIILAIKIKNTQNILCVN